MSVVRDFAFARERTVKGSYPLLPGEVVRLMTVTCLPKATELGLTGKAYVWIAAQSAVGSGIGGDAPDEFPAGMLGVYFATDPATMQSNIGTAMSVLGQALDTLAADETMNETEKRETLRPEVSCNDTGEVKWERGQLLYRLLRNVSVDMKVKS